MVPIDLPYVANPQGCWMFFTPKGTRPTAKSVSLLRTRAGFIRPNQPSPEVDRRIPAQAFCGAVVQTTKPPTIE